MSLLNFLLSFGLLFILYILASIKLQLDNDPLLDTPVL